MSQEGRSPSIPWTSSCGLGLSPWTAELGGHWHLVTSSSSLFLPHPPTKGPEITIPQLDTHTHTHTQKSSCQIWLSENSRQRRGQASYHGSLAIITSSTSGNGNKCAHVLKSPLEKISGAAWGTQWQALSQRKDLVWQAAAVLLDTGFVCKCSVGKPCSGFQNILIRKSRAFRIIKSHPEDIR